jgi:DNA-binding CsgD family transcriptional regulator
MKLTRPGSAHPLWVQISPLSGQYLSFYEMPCAALFIYDVDNNARISSTVLSNLYDVSPAEAKLAASLAMGSTLDAFAITHHKSINTVRVQLKQVFSKTGTHSQTDLLRLILNGPAMLQRVACGAQPRVMPACTRDVG